MWTNYPEIASELKLIEENIKNKVKTKNKLLSAIVNELFDSGGKRIRPAFTVASARFGNYNSERVIAAAGALEILHTATLVHDDIIDKAKLRRGRNTVTEKYGVDMAVYTGDFLFTKAILMLSRDFSIEKLDLVASSIKTICEGEVEQYIDKYNANTTILSYLKRISKKTAVLFSAACGLGAYAAECPEDIAKKLAKFGFNYGMAFQIKDDINDFVSNETAEGKPVGNDLAEGIVTLPAIFAIKNDSRLRDMVAALLEQKENMDRKGLTEAVRLVRELHGIDYTRDVLKKYMQRGLRVLEELPDNNSKIMLADMIRQLE